ncbi:hypothetical protein [Stakelama pacifica]|uniref:Uncharacterized protein n=1 Tax=Stakelama pacifica TaxID=517720 RepID=A0A4R6FJX5_9SPHN|nr:hypothetical protein [Stakelama pacifica]TDN81779.1 hypothetical protein EV664_107181 [Stakelama pacifica]GGO96547.1 hypothetical protein GCM10011329_23330 [Stakelama pacifica]
MPDYTEHTVTNEGKAPRGVYTRDGMVTILPGQTKPITISDEIAKEERAFLSFGKAASRKELSDHTVDELKLIADDEGADLEGITKKADIISAIELHREG